MLSRMMALFDLTNERIPTVYRKLSLILCLSCLPALSQAADYDIKKYCGKVSEAVGGSAQIELGCREQEADARAEIPAKNASPKILAYCDRVAKAVGGSYQILSGCIDQEQEAQAQLDK